MRMPAATIGIQTEDEWKAFSSQKIKETVWGPGSFAPALCSYSENRPMIDYILLDSAPRGRWWLQDARKTSLVQRGNEVSADLSGEISRFYAQSDGRRTLL